MFCDVFEKVIVVVVYIYVIYDENKYYVGFVIGKIKVVFFYGYIILRFELCFVFFVVEIY